MLESSREFSIPPPHYRQAWSHHYGFGNDGSVFGRAEEWRIRLVEPNTFEERVHRKFIKINKNVESRWASNVRRVYSESVNKAVRQDVNRPYDVPNGVNVCLYRNAKINKRDFGLTVFIQYTYTTRREIKTISKIIFEFFGLRLHDNSCPIWVLRRSRIYIAKMYVCLFVFSLIISKYLIKKHNINPF